MPDTCTAASGCWPDSGNRPAIKRLRKGVPRSSRLTKNKQKKSNDTLSSRVIKRRRNELVMYHVGVANRLDQLPADVVGAHGDEAGVQRPKSPATALSSASCVSWNLRLPRRRTTARTRTTSKNGIPRTPKVGNYKLISNPLPQRNERNNIPRQMLSSWRTGGLLQPGCIARHRD